MRKTKFCIPLLATLIFLIVADKSFAQETVRPMIWVKPADKAGILRDIAQNKWKKDYYDAFVKRIAPDLLAYQTNAKAYLELLPFNLGLQKSGQIPPFKTVLDADKDATAKRNLFQHYLKTAIDCGVIYYLTDDEKYAAYGASVFYTFMKAIIQITPSDEVSNGGWIYQDNHLREAREVGAQIPILYDFIYPYLAKGGTAYDFASKMQQKISEKDADKVFKTYINLALNHGGLTSNWPILESSSLVGNTLALSNEKDRAEYLQHYLIKDTPHQASLFSVANVFKDMGLWPESLNYSEGVTGLSTYLMTLLTKLNPTLGLGNKYPEILKALTVPYNLTYPNNTQTIQFGDGHRAFSRAYSSYEIAYYLSKLENNEKLSTEFGSLINSGIKDDNYNRAKLDDRSYEAHPYYDEPLRLFWFSPKIEGETKDYPQPTTNGLAFAGIAVQRNLSSTNNPKDGLMLFVGGGAFIHGHASGMNMELYGEGYVLGAKAGRDKYRSEIHENYYRLFAGHNTVIVNGASQGEGGWANNAINTVKKEAIEPEYNQSPVSENNSFSTTSFIDNKGDKAEAKQLRTLAIVRTSPTTGYYVDVYKSKSTLPNQYHDYIYHNIGDELILKGSDENFSLKPDENRYMANADAKWSNNKSYKNPGWHYFKNVQTSGNYNRSVTALFTAKSLGENGVNMKAFIPSTENIEYTKVLAPITDEAPKGYGKKLTPTLDIRKTGEAWDQPFAIIYEPYAGKEANGSVKNVESIKQNGIFKGFVVSSMVSGKAIKQIILTQDDEHSVFEDEAMGIKFTGRYAVITLNNTEEMESLYIGSGSNISYKNWALKSEDTKPISLNLTTTGAEVSIITDAKIQVTTPTNYKVKTSKTKI